MYFIISDVVNTIIEGVLIIPVALKFNVLYNYVVTLLHSKHDHVDTLQIEISDSVHILDIYHISQIIQRWKTFIIYTGFF